MSDAVPEPRAALPAPAKGARTLPLVPLRGMPPMPGTPMPLAVGRPFTRSAVEAATAADGQVVLLMQRAPEEDEPGPEDFYGVGVIARILRSFEGKDGALTVVVQAADRAVVREIRRQDGHFVADVHVPESHVPTGDVEIEALVQTARRLLRKIVEASASVNPELAPLVDRIGEPGLLADIVVGQLDLPREDKQAILETLDVRQRLKEAVQLLGRALEVAELGQRIESEVHGQLEEARRQMLLREQLKAIRKELGEDEDPELDRLRAKVAEGNLTPEALQAAERELGRLESMSPASPERGWVVTYLDWLTSLPWTRLAPERLDLAEAKRILDREHFGMEKAKERVLESLAVRRLKPDGRGAILCFVGPPGTGKTSLAQAIAEATGRELVRISIGGVSDESEIRGHRRTYVGALPGRILAAMRKAGTRNPVFVVDEIDKMAASFHGDPAAALLEVLDPEQNAAFVDRYVEVPFDLSRVLFITTANTLETLPRPLLDRLEVIEIPGYTEPEKLEIAERHLLPRQARAVGLDPARVKVGRSVLREIIEGWTREAGVRTLERTIAGALRKLALRAAMGEPGPFAVASADLPKLLGPRRFQHEAVERMAVPGVAMGLAWTPVGGEVLFVEASATKGSGRLTLTGSLGEVMKESATAALTWLRGRGRGMPDARKVDLHVHVPAGAVRKDGPSAGVALLAAIASALTGRKVRHDLAMTGEITLRGQILPVGGIREKLLAAHRAGVKTVLLPQGNAPDLEEVPEETRRALGLRLVERAEEVLDVALAGPRRVAGGPRRAPGRGKRKRG